MRLELGRPHEEEIFLREYWLSRCEGFCVTCPDGRLGYVEKVMLSPDGDSVSGFVVLCVNGRCPRRVTIPVEDVVALDPEVELLEVRTAPAGRGA